MKTLSTVYSCSSSSSSSRLGLLLIQHLSASLCWVSAVKVQLTVTFLLFLSSRHPTLMVAELEVSLYYQGLIYWLISSCMVC